MDSRVRRKLMVGIRMYSTFRAPYNGGCPIGSRNGALPTLTLSHTLDRSGLPLVSRAAGIRQVPRYQDPTIDWPNHLHSGRCHYARCSKSSVGERLDRRCGPDREFLRYSTQGILDHFRI